MARQNVFDMIFRTALKAQVRRLVREYPKQTGIAVLIILFAYVVFNYLGYLGVWR